MINVDELSVTINNQKILKGVSLHLPKTGLIGISGPSGCGKTTLLNCLSGLLDFKGSIEINKTHLEKLDENKKIDFRLKNVGFVFQDYKLFENQNVEDNVLLTYSASKLISDKYKKEVLKDILKVLGLKDKRKSLVKNLSGGEKQRVAIARSLICEPLILLCDEPTGNLDTKNSKNIMELLQKVSMNRLVVVVSHDLNSLKKYCNEIFYMNDGLIVKKENFKNSKNYKGLKIKNVKPGYKKTKIGASFLCKYALSKIKQKQIRSFITISISALGLMSFGLSFTLTESISSNIKNVYSSAIQDDRILLTKRNKESGIESITAMDESDFEEIKYKYENEISRSGYYYFFDFENNFPDSNEFVLNKEGQTINIEGLSIRNINEFLLLDNEEIYPHSPTYLNNNEIILGMNLHTIQEICYELRIKRTVESLSEYLAIKPFSINLNLTNLNWTYETITTFNVVGFVLQNTNSIYHLNPYFNEYVFENYLKLPASNNVYGVLNKPWTLRKIPFIESKNIDYLLEQSLTDIENQRFLFETNFNGDNYADRIYLFNNTLNGLSPYIAKIISDDFVELSKPIFGSNFGHYIYPTMLMMGFSYQTFLSNSISKINQVIEDLESMRIDDNENIECPEGVLQSYFLNSQQNSFVFDVFDEKLVYGNSPKNYSQIVISSTLAKNLFGDIEVVGEKIYLSHIMGETIDDENILNRVFKTSELEICGICDGHENKIYHSPYWTIIYYQKHLKVSRFLLDINTISFEVEDKNNIDLICNDLNQKFKGYEFTNPTKDLDMGIDEVCSYVSVALLFFSIISFLISILLMVITNYLHISENKKDFGLLLVLGIKKKETKKLLFSYSIIISLFSFTLACVYLFLVNLLINLEISVLLKAPLSFGFSLKSLLLMFVVSLLLSIFSSIFLIKKITNVKPLDIIKQ